MTHRTETIIGVTVIATLLMSLFGFVAWVMIVSNGVLDADREWCTRHGYEAVNFGRSGIACVDKDRRLYLP